MIDLSVVIVSFNSKDFLVKCLDSLLKSNLNIEIIVVDNASKDGTEKVMEKYPNVKFIKNEQNLGFSKANNIGIKKTRGEYILFLNPDVEVGGNTIIYMLKFIQKQKDAGAATCKVILPNGKLDDSCHRGFPTPLNSFFHFSGLSKLFPKSRLFGGYNLEFLDLSVTHEIDALAGSFMLVRRKAGEEANWWDEDYFFYGEDLDFCYQLKQKKWKIYFVPQVKAIHYKGISSGIKKISEGVATADLETKKRANKERFRAMKVFYSKYYEDKYPKFVTWLVMQGINLKFWLSKKSL